MTIAICLKVGDGVVLGADSAVTLPGSNGFPGIFFNAEKISNLVKGLPIGAVMWGHAGFAGRSVTSLAKDLRRRLSGQDPAHLDWALDPDSYTIEEVAQRYADFFYDELYRAEFADTIDNQPSFGAILAGFSAEGTSAEIWTVETNGGVCSGPVCQFNPVAGAAIIWRGMQEPLTRIIRGWSYNLLAEVMANGTGEVEAMQMLDAVAPFLHPAMPLQDALELVEYLVQVACGYYRFSLQGPVVAPPIDLSAITLHEGFRWVRRKHYYEPRLNPQPEPYRGLVPAKEAQ